MLSRLFGDVVFQLDHWDNAARTLVLDDSKNSKSSWRITVRPNINAIDNFLCSSVSLDYGIFTFPNLEVS